MAQARFSGAGVGARYAGGSALLSLLLVGCFDEIGVVNIEDGSGSDSTAASDPTDPTDPTVSPTTGATASDDGTTGGPETSSGSTDASSTGPAPDADGDGAPADIDCDDMDATRYPGAPELCDLVDNDCDRIVDWGRSVPTHYATVSAALDGAEPGEHVCVGPGSYTEAIEIGPGVTVESVDGPGSTTLVGPGDDRVVTISDADDVTVRGLTLRGGLGNSGAGLRVVASVGVLLEDLDIRENTGVNPDGDCAGVAMVVASGSEVTGRRLRIENNESTCRFTSGIVRSNTESTLILENSSVSGNAMHASESSRSPITAANGTLVLTNVIVAGNLSEAGINTYGAAIYTAAPGDYRFTNLTVRRNVATSEAFARGGAIVFNAQGKDVTEATLVNVSVSGNVVEGPQSAVSSAGLGFEGTNYDIDISYTNMWMNDPGDYPAAFPSPTGTANNIAVAPQFVDGTGDNPTQWDLRLLDDSELVDAGSPDLNDADGSRSDIGAHGGPGSDDW